MNKIIILFTVSFMLVPVVNAQKIKGNKNVITEERDVTGFTSIILKDKIDVFIEESSSCSVLVETDENLQSAVETRVYNGVLEVYLSQEIKRKKALKVYIGVTDSIRRIEALDKVDLVGEDEIHTGQLELIAKDYASIKLILNSEELLILGGDKSTMDLSATVNKDIAMLLDQRSHVKINASAEKINISLTDNASIKLNGNCKELISTSDTNANIRAKELLTDYADIKVTGRSDIYINVAKEVILDSEEMAEIFIYGSPKIILEKFNDRSTLYKR